MRLNAPSASTVSMCAGAIALLAGLLVPAPGMIEFLRTVPPDLAQSLTWGSWLFKLGLVVLGLALIILTRLYPIDADGASRERSAAPQRKLVLFALLGLLLAASALRLYSLNSGLWHDEILAYVLYAKLPLGQIITTYDSENQHLLYSLLAHVSLSVFGDSGASLRLPAALFGIASIGALYLLGRELVGAREALLASALLTFSYHHIWFSQNARGYTALLFFALLASWLLLRALKQSRPALWLWFALATALGVYAHLTMLFVTLGHFAVYGTALWLRRKGAWPERWAGLVWGFGLAGLLTFQLYALVLPQVLTGLNETSEVAEWTQPLWTLLELAKGLQLGFAGGVVAIGALVVGGAGLLSCARKNIFLVEMLIIPPAVGAAVVMAAGHHLWPRFFFFAFGFAALVAIRGAVLSGEWLAGRLSLSVLQTALAGPGLAAVLVLAGAKSVPYVYAPKQDYAGALAFVEASYKPGDEIVTVGLATFTYRNFYQLDWREIRTIDELNAVRTHATRTWLLYTLAPEAESVYPAVMRSVQSDFKVVKEFYGSVGDGNIDVCLADSPPAAPATGRVEHLSLAPPSGLSSQRSSP